MSLFSDITDAIGSVVGYDTLGSDIGGGIENLFSSGGSTVVPTAYDTVQTGLGYSKGEGSFWNSNWLGPAISAATGLATIPFEAEQNELGFEHQKELAQMQIDAALQQAEMAAGAKIKAAKIAAEEQKRNTMMNAYNNWAQSKFMGGKMVGDYTMAGVSQALGALRK